MIFISPLAEYTNAFQNLDDYKLRIKGVHLNVERPKTVSISTTIDGGSQISIFKKSIAGVQQTIKTTLKPDDVSILRNIAYSDVNEWLLVYDNRRFVVCVTLENIKQIEGVHSVIAVLTFIKEL